MLETLMLQDSWRSRGCRSLVAVSALTAIAWVANAHAAVVPYSIRTNPANGHKYLVLTASTWEQAQAEAESLGGNLVTINDAQENLWVFAMYARLRGYPFGDGLDPTGYWIGLNDIAEEGVFEWVSGEPVTFTNWAFGEPNNVVGSNEDWVELTVREGPVLKLGEWNDGTTYLQPAIVEFNIPEPSTFVLIVPLLAQTICRRDRIAA